jgi:Domain of unknown function (DUF3597)
MSVFGSIMSRIFHHGGGGQAQAASPASSSAQAAPASAASPSAGPTSAGASGGAATTATASSGSGQHVDVEAVLNGLATKAGQKLDWRHSIVDLMKLLDLDSSLTARKELATELHYTGDTNDSATMNVWLHKQVMKKLAENGGKVPDDLRH